MQKTQQEVFNVHENAERAPPPHVCFSHCFALKEGQHMNIISDKLLLEQHCFQIHTQAQTNFHSLFQNLVCEILLTSYVRKILHFPRQIQTATLKYHVT